MKKIVFIFVGLLSRSVFGMDGQGGDPLGLGSEGSSVPTTGHEREALDLSASWVAPGLGNSVTSLNPAESVRSDGNTQPGTPLPDGERSPHTPEAPALPAVEEEEEAHAPAPHSPNIFDPQAQATVLAQVQSTITACPDIAALERLAGFGRSLSLAAKARIDELNPPPAAPKITWIQAHLMGPIKPWMNYESLTALAFVAAILIPRLMGVAHSDFKA